MQVLQNDAYSNFVDSINSDQTRRLYEYSISQFLKYCNKDLDSFLRLSQQEISNLIINYLVSKKISRQYKLVIFSAIKLAAYDTINLPACIYYVGLILMPVNQLD